MAQRQFNITAKVASASQPASEQAGIGDGQARLHSGSPQPLLFLSTVEEAGVVTILGTELSTSQHTLSSATSEAGVAAHALIVQVDRATGALVRYERDGRPYISAPVRPCLYRAPTDNDRGGSGGTSFAARCAAGLACVPLLFQVACTLMIISSCLEYIISSEA